MIKLTQKETAILLGCLNDSSSYPFQEYEEGVEESSNNFEELFKKVYKENSLYKVDIDLAMRALAQCYNHMDQPTLDSLYGDVRLVDIKSLLSRLDSYRNTG